MLGGVDDCFSLLENLQTKNKGWIPVGLFKTGLVTGGEAPSGLS
jgi:hypothetical protein